jgi:hypothetical protein
MSYTKTYIFGEGLLVGHELGEGDRALLTLIFTINDEGENEVHLAQTRGLRWIKYGETSINIDPSSNEYLVLPKEYTFEIADDSTNELMTLLYGSGSDKVEKEFYVKFEVKYDGELNYHVEFSGYNIADLLEFPPLNKVHTFTAAPRTNVLNETYLFPKEYDPEKWDPANLNTAQPNNPLNLNWTRPTGNYVKWDWYYLTDIIEKILQKINPDITVEYLQNWKFLGDTSPEYGSFSHLTNDELGFVHLICDSSWIGSVFAGKNHQAETLGELLAAIAFDFGCMAIIESQDKAYFREVGTFDENNVQAVGALCDDGYKLKYKYKKVEFTEVKSILYSQDVKSLNRFVRKQWNQQETGFCPQASKNKISGTNGLQKQTISVIDTNAIFFPVDTYRFSNLKAAVTGDATKFYSIFGANKPGFDVSSYPQYPRVLEGNFLPLSYLLAEYHFRLKGSLYNTQVHEHKFNGVNYSFTKGYVYGGQNFSIIGMKKNWDYRLTTFESLRKGDAAGSTGSTGTDTPPDPLFSLLTSDFYADYTYVAQITYEEANTGVISIIEVNPGVEIETITMIIDRDHPFVGVQSMQIEDEEEVLVPAKRLIWDKVKARIVSLIEKVYTTKRTIKVRFTPADIETGITDGACNIKIKFLSRTK